MRSGPPGPVLIDLPFDVQMAEIEFDIDTYAPSARLQAGGHPRPDREGHGHAGCRRAPADRGRWRHHQRRCGDLLVEFAELTGVPVIPTLMGWGSIPDDHPLMAGMCGLQTSHRYGNATMLASDFVMGIGNRWANRHTGSVEVYTDGRKFVHVDIEPTQIGRMCLRRTYGIVSDAKARPGKVHRQWPARAEGRAALLQLVRTWAKAAQCRRSASHACCARPTLTACP